MKRLLPFLLLTVLAPACTREVRIDPALAESEAPCLHVKGKMVYMHDDNTGQLAYNATEHRFRAGNDNMSEYFSVTCSETPIETGQTVQAGVVWTQGTGNQSRQLSFRVEKVNAEGTVWLWNGKEGIGAVVRILH